MITKIGLILIVLFMLSVLIFALWWNVIFWYQDKIKDEPPTKDEWKTL